MAQNTTSAQSIDLSSLQPAFVHVLSDANVGPTRVLVSHGAMVEYDVYLPRYPRALKRYVLSVWIDGQFIGWHCGERSGEPVRFERESDAVRLADTRNAVWAARCCESEVA